ncbi:unnamed protein product [Miscanthus lutarioriparius]|uniref:Frataxin n=1 Tax=Miscanthus lutarioriparius TaxID=422564 RepID=A0A811NRD1_9POAL|nr:unnamed protein product [Miscanthus lutarioriparius]
MSSRKVLLGLASGRRLPSRTQQLFWAADLPVATTSRSLAAAAATALPSGGFPAALLFSLRTISSTRLSTQSASGDAPGPSAVHYKLIMQEDEFHKLADETIHDLLEKLEEYGDSIQMDGFDIDYGNQVLTLRLGDLGTGPSRFDWDVATNGWIYKRTGVNLVQLLEKEIG